MLSIDDGEKTEERGWKDEGKTFLLFNTMKIVVEDEWKCDEIFTGKKMMKSEGKKYSEESRSDRNEVCREEWWENWVMNGEVVSKFALGN